MGFWDAMLRGRIVGRSLQWAKRSLTGYAALQLPLHFASRALFQRVRAADYGEAPDGERN
jgi:hypothetical protein